MKTIEILRNAASDNSISSSSIVRSYIRHLAQNGYVHTGYYQGHGRRSKAIDKTDDVVRILRSLHIAHATGNDAPRGGVTGNFVIITSEAVMKEIGKSIEYKALAQVAGREWKYVKPTAYTHDELVARAEKELSFTSKEDENDEDGRYWLNCYHGCGTYELAILNGRIAASLYYGFHPTLPRGENRIAPSREEWMEVLAEVVTSHIGEGWQWVKADGSGTYFYLRNMVEAELLNDVKEYDVPDMMNGGLHHNVEIR